ncbi:MAG: NADH-quinone oxidoreductase subunit NuoF [Candidatus Aminicenantes bacterium]|nr:NADH-quinone oxidoreductase subunit NuoF [Candidatus Aminicenantes bacterium]
MKKTDRLETAKDLKARIDELVRARKADTRPSLTVSAGTCGRARGSMKVIESLRRAIKAQKLEKRVHLKITGCHGFCEAEPNILIHPHGLFYQKVEPRKAKAIITETVRKKKVLPELLYVDPETGKRADKESAIPFYGKQKRIVLGDNPLIDPTSIDDYFSIGGYRPFLKALTKMTPDEVVGEVKASGLRGRGGAGFPTGTKWELARKAKGDVKYVICNADEGDPGAYMDRSLLEGNPHRVLEGMMIGAYAIGARDGYLYVRDEYPLAVKHVTLAIDELYKIGLLGKNILGTGFDFDIHIAKGAGAFVCGEETALIASIEGRVGEPRQRPPFPAQKGLWRKPTNINNVETWGTVPLIVDKGAEWFSKIGTDNSKGTKIFSLVGKINNTGLVEVPMGMTLREIIFDVGGGIPGNGKFKAVQTGGPSGGCIPKEMLDLPIDYQSLAQAGSIMGSGGMIVMDEKTCMVDLAKYFLNFLRDESCGKCVSCREGTQRMHEILKNVTDGRAALEDIAVLEDLAAAVKDASMCGLGQTAANPVLSTLKYFRSEYEKHVIEKRCPAMVCKEIVSAPCQYVCPLGQEAATYISLVARRQFEEAFRIIRKDNPLPSVCGRVCSRACESACRAGEIGEPIAIRALKRSVMDWAKAKGMDKPEKFPVTKEDKVAIVGAGPAGLAAAYELVRKGYPTRIFESLPVAGGMLRVTIPDHRLPKDILEDDLQYLIDCGVNIKTNMTMGKDFSLDDLYHQGYKAVFLATGAHKPIEIGVPGEEAEGVLQALEYLKDHHLGIPVPLGAKVAVVGGGNSAIDAARVAFRDKRVKEVTVLYRRTKDEMPAYAEEVEAALEEGIKIRFLTAPTRVRTSDGRVVGIECLEMKLGDKDESGRRKPVPVPGSEFQVPADTLILAISERAYTPYLRDSDGLTLSDKWGTIIVDPATLATTRPGVFAGGDVVTGPSSVVDAIAAGKLAARSIENYLEGRILPRTHELTRPSMYVEPVKLSDDEVQNAKRAKMPHLPVSKRKSGHEEIELGFPKDVAVKEARRCLRCDLETEDGKKAIGRDI